MTHRVVYIWQGQRHWGPFDYPSRNEADVAVRGYRKLGYRAWVERIDQMTQDT